VFFRPSIQLVVAVRDSVLATLRLDLKLSGKKAGLLRGKLSIKAD
jgi:hypothetical protein